MFMDTKLNFRQGANKMKEVIIKKINRSKITKELRSYITEEIHNHLIPTGSSKLVARRIGIHKHVDLVLSEEHKYMSMFINGAFNLLNECFIDRTFKTCIKERIAIQDLMNGSDLFKHISILKRSMSTISPKTYKDIFGVFKSGKFVDEIHIFCKLLKKYSYAQRNKTVLNLVCNMKHLNIGGHTTYEDAREAVNSAIKLSKNDMDKFVVILFMMEQYTPYNIVSLKSRFIYLYNLLYEASQSTLNEYGVTQEIADNLLNICNMFNNLEVLAINARIDYLNIIYS